MDKTKSSSKPKFAQGGGKGGMFGKQHAGPQKSGVSGKDPAGSGGKFAKGGGKGGMFGKQSASPKAPGKSGK